MKSTAVILAVMVGVVAVSGLCGCGSTGNPQNDVVLDAAQDVGPDAEPDVASPYPMDDVIRMNQIQIVATHNSYHIAPEWEDPLPESNYTQPLILDQLDTFKVRQLELDIWENEENVFNCYHGIFADEGSRCRNIVDCLTVAKGWSDKNPAHVPLIFIIEIKALYGADYNDLEGVLTSGFFDRLHTMFTDVFPADRIITPDTVRGSGETLAGTLMERGWPTLGESRGKIMIVLNTTSDRIAIKNAYVQKYPGLKGALMFAKDGPDDGWGSVVELNNVERDQDAIEAAVAKNYLIRSAADAITWDDAQIAKLAPLTPTTGVNWINTDFLTAQPRGDYVFMWPSEYPVRCNPVNAPDGCEDWMLE